MHIHLYFPTIQILLPFFCLEYLIALIKLTETFLFKLPPPTENIIKISFLLKSDNLR